MAAAPASSPRTESRSVLLARDAHRAELLVALGDELLGRHRRELAEVTTKRRAELLRGLVRIAVGAADRLLDRFVDDAQPERVAREELELCGRVRCARAIAPED